MQSVKSDFVMLRISTELLAQIAKAAADAEASVSDYVRAIVEEHLERQAASSSPGRISPYRRSRQKSPRLPRY